ncbi:MAG: hypothetical protein EOO43_09670 [Flavobacterium sp.]|nr:MAG: hypothetical protein EOO43_09670 [Flavobacterium sp.]
MKLTAAKILPLLFLFIGFFSKAQTTKDFEQDFHQLVLKGYPQNMVDSLFQKYNHILFFFNSNSQLAATISGKEASAYPLTSFRSQDLYQKNIDLLLQDGAFYKNSLGYFMAAATNDTSKIKPITSILAKTGYKDFWAANILIVLKTRDIAPVLKTIISLEGNDAVPYLIEPFLQLDVDVIERFALDSIKSKNASMQYLAIRAMAKGEFNSMKEVLLRDVVTNGADNLKGWAISVLASFGAKDMLSIVQPYLDNKDLRSVALKSLANSTSVKDEQYLDDQLKRDPVTRELLRALVESNREQSVRKWFKVLRDRDLPKDYFAFITYTTVINNDIYFDEVCEAIIKTKNQNQLYPLFDYFSDRKDERSIQFLITCLSRPDQDIMVKYAIIKNLKGKYSDLVKQAIPNLMKNANISDIHMIYLLIEYKNRDYHDLVRNWLKEGKLDSASKTLCNDYLNM